MSEKTKKTKVQSVENVITGLNKKKHNSKRRCKKSKAKIETEVFKSESSTVDEVVNYLCNAISNSESETSLSMTPLKMSKGSPDIKGDYFNENCYLNTTCDVSKQTPSTSTNFNTLFKNLQVCEEKSPSVNVTDFLNLQHMKNKCCKFLPAEDLKRLEFEKFQKGHFLNEQNTDAPKNIHLELFNLNLIPQNCPQKSILAKPKTSSSNVSPKTKESVHSTNKNCTKNKKLTGCFSADKLLSQSDNFKMPITLSSKLFSNKLEETLKKGFQRKGNSQKKNKNLKTDVDSSSEVEKLNADEKVILNLENFKDSSESSNSKSQGNKKGKKQQSQKITEADYKFPKHLTVGELKSLSELGVLMSGIIRINPKNYKEAYITAPDKGMDILIEGLRDRNRALEGDEVYFILKAKEHHRATCDSTDLQRTAVVVGLKTLNHDRGAIGTLHVIKNKSNSFVLFSPRDSKLPRLRIQRNDWPEGFLENSEGFKKKLYFAKISQWNDLRYAEGKLIKEIGETGELETETEAILLKLGLNVLPYDESLKKFLPPASFKIMNADTENREDFRKDCVFTVDPDSAKDLDDAVSCKRLPNGNFEVGVHIADVSYFLNEGTPLDLAVAERGVTVYLVQKAYHMLPFELCQLCSLIPGEDKLSFSVIWEITPECKIVNHRFTRSIINSCAQFTYNQIQSIIDNVPVEDIIYPKIYGNHSTENIKEIIFFLHKVAVFLRDRRFKNGALKIDQKKINFLLDKNQLPVDYKEYYQKPSHQIIEEFMLLANITVAEKLSCCFPNLAFLRSHPPPLPYVLKKLQNTLEKYGIIMDISSSKSLYSSLLRYSGEDYESLARMLVLQNALTKPMSRAKYYCAGLCSNKEERRHYALCVPLYTHFTSPIRRYADIMVHRLMAAILKYTDPPNWIPEKVQLIAENCNRKKYAAKLAEEMSIELYHNIYIGQRGSVICDAVVCDIKDKSFDCIDLSTGLHQRLYFEHIQGQVSQAKEDGIWRLTIKWPKNEYYEAETIQIVEMFSIVKIELKRLSVLKIEANLLRNE